MASVKRLLVVTHATHYRHNGALYAYGPYVREMDLWCSMFPEVVIAAPCIDGPPEGDGLPLCSGNVSMFPIPASGGAKLSSKLWQLCLLPWIVIRLSTAMMRADAVHVRCPGNLGLLGVILGPIFCKRLVAKYAGQWTGYPGEARSVRLQRYLLGSRWWRGPVTVYGQWPNQPDHVVPFFTSVMTLNQVQRAQEMASKERPGPPFSVLFVGRLSKAKNVDILIRSIAELANQGIETHCNIVGHGEHGEALRDLATQLGIDDRIHFRGGVEFDDVFEYYANAHILVLASETEGWPKAIAEAMACGVVCIGSKRGLVPWMLDEGRGFVVTPRDLAALTSTLKSIIVSPQLRIDTSARAAVFGQRYSLQSLREQLVHLLSERWDEPFDYDPHAIEDDRSPRSQTESIAAQDQCAAHRTCRGLGVMQLVDSLAIGGTERVAVSLANTLAANGARSFLCTTRADGPQASMISPDVGRLTLNRKSTFEWKAIRRLVRFIRDNNISVLHSHSTSILMANIVSRFAPYPRVVWHDHFGPNDQKERPVWLFRPLLHRANAVIAVSQSLADWSNRRLKIPNHRISCLPNFVELTESESEPPKLPGMPDGRVVCVANLRPVKDQITLIRAMKIVVSQHPKAHLLLVGGLTDSTYVAHLRDEIESSELTSYISIMGPRNDVQSVLRACDIGVLSSTSEGLPVSLLEYGAAGLPVVVTDVGECSSVVEHGRSGLVVPKERPQALAEAIVSLLDCKTRRGKLGRQFRDRIKECYSPASVVGKLECIYADALAR